MTTTTFTPFTRRGVLLRREAVALGIDDDTLTRAVRDRRLVRVRQGAYVESAHWKESSPEQQHRLLTEAVTRIYGGQVMVSHASAVLEHGGPSYGLDLDAVHITHPSGRGRLQGAVRHHQGAPRATDPARGGGGRVTSIARTICEATIASASTEVGVVIASHFLHQRLVTHSELATARDILEPCPGSLLLRTAHARADGRLESAAESRCWYGLTRSGDLPPMTPQYPIFDHRGVLVARVDFAIESLGILIEVGGRAKYTNHLHPGETTADVLIRERRRENLIRELTGWDIIRITWADLDHPERIIERIRAIVIRRAA